MLACFHADTAIVAEVAQAADVAEVAEAADVASMGDLCPFFWLLW